MERLISFAQEREDIILYHLLKKVNVPIRYIDVGANDPIIYSVTKFFYNRGARGINIEPQKAYIDNLNRDRPCDINLEVGISDKVGELTLYGKGVLATFNYDEDTENEMEYSVPVITLSDVFNKYVKKDEDIHFLKIDVEGWERQCLQGMDFIRFRPWILCIESVSPGTDIPDYEGWEGLVFEHDYVLLGSSAINRYYAAKERLQVLQDFRQGKELDTIYAIVNYQDTWQVKLKSVIQKSLQRTSSVLERTSSGQKIKSSLKSTFIWRKIRKKL